jgi:hypothetical protein
VTDCFFCGSPLKRQSFLQGTIKSFWNECPNQSSKEIEHLPENCLACGEELSWKTVLGEKRLEEVRNCTNEKCSEKGSS